MAADVGLDPDRPVVLVTGAGGPAGVSVLRALQAAGHRVVAVDTDPDAAGLRLADQGAVGRPFSDPAHAESLGELAIASGAQVLVSTLAEEMAALAEQAEVLDAAGLAHWLPTPAAVRACVDKWRFAEVLAGAGLPAPCTALAAPGLGDEVPGPWVVKPRFGRGSRDVVLVDHPAELDWAVSRVPDAVVQTRLVGREFTVDALVDRDGSLTAAVPRWRLETRGGISVKGETFTLPGLTDAVGVLLRAVGLDGISNVQGFVDPDGAWSFVEINPRFSGGLPLSLAAGADLVGEYVRGALGLPLRPERLRHRDGVRMVRYFEEIFEG